MVCIKLSKLHTGMGIYCWPTYKWYRFENESQVAVLASRAKLLFVYPKTSLREKNESNFFSVSRLFQSMSSESSVRPHEKSGALEFFCFALFRRHHEHFILAPITTWHAPIASSPCGLRLLSGVKQHRLSPRLHFGEFFSQLTVVHLDTIPRVTFDRLESAN